ncbi:MAG: glycine--tRNA ligase [Candidatus Niyogibacteria bacterium]|nr:glycine--tRNA ligase [Candidatus Niyogibacteria bacterium]
MANDDLKLKMEKIVSLAKRRGFIYAGSEIYGGLAGVWDYGPLGVELKNNIKNLWWKKFVSGREDMFGLDAAILMNARVWEKSGHAAGFSDPLAECKKCHQRFRGDKIKNRACPNCGGELAGERQFNMMFETFVGPAKDSSAKTYLRPETAQGIFVNFKNIVDSFHPKIPFGVAQIGKAFRNEISPGDFIFRSREFEQMEIEYFIRPPESDKDWQKFFDYWVAETRAWLEQIGLTKEKIYERNLSREDLAHYSKKTADFEYDFPFGREELCGLAYRTDFDLKNHSLDYYDEETKKTFIPHVIEPTFGVDRLVLALLAEAYTEDEMGGEKRIFLKFKPALAPIKAAVFPLLKNKPALVEKAREVYESVKKEIPETIWDDNGNIGKRYRRQDEIGTPYCLTVDFETLENDTVTVRDRDTGKQERIKIKMLLDFIRQNF